MPQLLQHCVIWAASGGSQDGLSLRVAGIRVGGIRVGDDGLRSAGLEGIWRNIRINHVSQSAIPRFLVFIPKSTNKN
jgi:hypothetical protein